MADVERPKTSRGSRIRPPSRGGRVKVREPDSDEEDFGRPISRRGYTPETYQRSDYDQYSRDAGMQSLSLDVANTSSGSSEGEFSSSPLGHKTSPTQHHVSPETMSPTQYGQQTYRVDNRYGPNSHMQESRMHENQIERPMVRPSPRQRPSSASKRGRTVHNQLQPDKMTSPYGDSPQNGSYLANWEQQNKTNVKRDSFCSDQGVEHGFSPRYEDRGDNFSPQHDPRDSFIADSRPVTREKKSKHRNKSARKRPKSSKRIQRDLSPESIIENLPTASMMRPTSSLTRYKLLPAIGTPQAPQREQSFFDGLPGKMDKLSVEKDNSQIEEEHLFLDQDHSYNQKESESRYGFHERSREDASSEEEMESRGEDKHLVQHYEEDPLTAYPGDSMDSYETLQRYEEGRKYVNVAITEPGEDEERILLAVRMPNGTRYQRYFRPSDPLKLIVDIAEIKCETNLSDFQLVRNAPHTVFSDLNVLITQTDLQDRTVLYLDEKD